jgi:general stress protein 26
MPEDIVKIAGKLIDRQSVAFIGSVDEAGFPCVKAMLAPRKREGLKVFYFTTNASSRRTAHYRLNPKASVYFCEKRFFRAALFTGTMEVLLDAASREMIWREDDTLYYPRGIDDPDYAVLKFTAQAGRYYANFGSQTFAVE